MNTEAPVSPAPVDRRRWWIHLILIGGYFVPALTPFAISKASRRPALLSSTSGLVVMCGIQIALFAIVFGLGWLASRASREQLLLRWRPGWWVVPLGIAYSIAMRFAVGILAVAIIAVLLGSGLVTRESLIAFVSHQRPSAEKLVNLSAMQSYSAYFWLTLTLNSFVVAGLREEMWRAGTLAAMRALWPNIFDGRDGQVAAVALIAIVFGLAHLTLGLVPAAAASILGFLPAIRFGDIRGVQQINLWASSW